MKKIVMIALIAGLVVMVLTDPARAQTVKDIGEFKTQSHVVLIAEQNDTEVEITVDGKHRGTMFLQAGVNYFCYQTDIKPDVEVLAFGDTLNLKMTEGKGGDWYTFARISPPVDGDGEVYE